MILAGDIGGTKTLLGWFEPGAPRPAQVRVERYPTTEFDGLPSMLRTFFAGEAPAIDVACFGIAGPVLQQRAQMTNVPWLVSAADVAQRFGIAQVRLLNDLEAMAYAVPALRPDELLTLQAGEPDAEGSAALIAAGTGLGAAVLHRIGGRLLPMATEMGHTDFAARTDRELDLVRVLRSAAGRAELESVVSGVGLIAIAHFTHGAATCPVAGALDAADRDSAARVSAAAMARTCAHCVETLELFVSAYGAAAGNLALHAVARAGVFIGGGIAPRIQPLMTDGRFRAAFRAKQPLDDLLARIPLHVVLNADAGILGAAIAGSIMHADRPA